MRTTNVQENLKPTAAAIHGVAATAVLVLFGTTPAALAQTGSEGAAAPAEPAASAAPAALPAPVGGGTVEHVKVHSVSLEGNLQGNSPERDAFVYLPPSYGTEPARRYPVVYILHGWGPSGEQFTGTIDLKPGTDRAVASGSAREMIVVVPDALSVLGGSMYSTSLTSGDFEGFIARDLVAYVDQHYRTIARRESRGLAGHSMGGYGTLRIGMKYPDTYSSLYAMSSCCLVPYTGDGRGIAEAASIKSLEEAKSAPLGTRLQLTLASAWSPNPAKPPLYVDLPTENGEARPLALTKWNANVPLAMIDQYIPNLYKYEAIGLEVGLQDGLIGSNRTLSDVLTAYGISHIYETYFGDHTNKVPVRYETRVLPFFSTMLKFE